MIMAVIRFHDSSMNIHDRKLHVLLTLVAFSKSIHAFQQKPAKSVQKILRKYGQIGKS